MLLRNVTGRCVCCNPQASLPAIAEIRQNGQIIGARMTVTAPISTFSGAPTFT